MQQGSGIIRVLIVEDNLIFRDLLSRELASQGTLEVIGAVADGESAIQFSRELTQRTGGSTSKVPAAPTGGT